MSASRLQPHSRGRTADLSDFATPPLPRLVRDFAPCAATSTAFLYGSGSQVIICRHGTLEIERRFSSHTEAVQLLTVDNGTGRYVASYDAGQTAIVWDMGTGEETARFTCYDHLTAATWMKNGCIAFGNVAGHVIQFDPRHSEEKSTMTLATLPISALAVANDNVTHAIGYLSGTLMVANIQNGRFTPLYTLNNNRPPSPIVTLQWHSSTPQQKSTMLAAQTRGGDLRVWSVPKVQGSSQPITVRHLTRTNKGEGDRPGPNWMAWSKNGRIIQYSENETLSWDVRTRHVTQDVIPTIGSIKGLAIHGPSATLFTLGPNNTVQQFDLNAPSVLVKNVQHPAHVLPPSPPVSIEEIERNMATTSESDIPFDLSDVTESEGENGYVSGNASMERGYSEYEATSFASTSGVGGDGKRTPMGRGGRSKTGLSDHTYISTGTRTTGLNSARNTPQQQNYTSRIHDFQSQSSLNTASTHPRMRSSSKQSHRSDKNEDASKIDLFKFTRSRLADVPYKHHLVVDGIHLTNEDLRQQMLGTIFGWNGSVRDLILDEMARHPRGSSVRIMLSKWIDMPISDDEIMASTDLRSSSDWMLLALGGIGTQPSQQKLGRLYITKLLEQGELHAAVTIMLSMGDYNDAIEVYYSHKHYLEALILTCLFNPTVWERQSAIVKKWGEWAVQHGEQQLAIRCFACDRESSETWKSPSAQQLTFQPLGPDMFSPPMSPPAAHGPQRGIIKSSALKLITSFGGEVPVGKEKFFSEDYEGKTPVPGNLNTSGLHVALDAGADPTTAILRPSNRSAFNTPTSVRSHASGTSSYSRKRLESIGEMPSDAKGKREPVNRTVTRTQGPPEPDMSSNYSSGMAMSRAATASPMMMRDNFRRLTAEQTLPGPGPNVSQKLEQLHTRQNSLNSSRDRINKLGLNIDTNRAQSTEDTQPAVTSARYHWPRRRGPSSVSSITSGSTSRSMRPNKLSIDSHVNSIDAATDYRRNQRAASKERDRNVSQERGVREKSADRGRSALRIYPAKRSPTSPVPMSPEDIVNLKAKTAASIDAQAMRANNSSRASNRSARSRSHNRGMSMAERGLPLTINTMQTLSRLNTGVFKSPTSPTLLSAFIPNLSGSEDEKDYQLALADKEQFRQARSASRGARGKTPEIPKTVSIAPGDSISQISKRIGSSESARGGPASRHGSRDIGSREHAGDLRKHKEDRQRKKEIAARELEERRRELVNNTQAGPIVHPSDLPSEPVARPATATGMRMAAHEIGRSNTADPYTPRNHGMGHRQNFSVGLPATPKAMRLVHDNAELKESMSIPQFLPSTSFADRERGSSVSEQQQKPEAKEEPPLFLSPMTFNEKSKSLDIDRDAKVAPAPETALPETNGASDNGGDGGGLTLLPSTVYQPPGKSIPRCQSAPIPEEPSFQRGQARVQTRPRQDSQSSRYNRDQSPAPARLKELQHLVSFSVPQSKSNSQAVPPPPPPPPPMGSQIPMSPNNALASGLIEIVPSPSTTAPKPSSSPLPVPPSDMMVPVLAAPQPPLKGHSRGRSAGEHSFAGRISKATERLRSASRTRKDNPTRAGARPDGDMAPAPYESVVPGVVGLRGVDLDKLPTGLKQEEFI